MSKAYECAVAIDEAFTRGSYYSKCSHEVIGDDGSVGLWVRDLAEDEDESNCENLHYRFLIEGAELFRVNPKEGLVLHLKADTDELFNFLGLDDDDEDEEEFEFALQYEEVDVGCEARIRDASRNPYIMRLRITNIDWDDDGEGVDLPKEIILDVDDEEYSDDDTIVADALSEEYGYCVNSYHAEPFYADGRLLHGRLEANYCVIEAECASTQPK
ncbi:hypothetical protein [Sphingomonas sp. RB1R13]|uniref:hypothetical protein n=1 Tax=Sphingomonas sp. RB1R13 TaxID=3096159 RepID=UPI002FCB33D5